MPKLLENLSKEEKLKIKKKEMPSFTPPMLAKLTRNFFSDPEWIFENKLDGERCLAFKKNNRVTLKSRNDKRLNISYPELVEAFETQKNDHDFIVDGEIVAFQGKITSFSKLQARFGVISAEIARKTGVKVYYYIFDIIYLDGYDVTKLPLLERKTLLKQVISFKGPLRFSTHRSNYGIEYHQEACKKGLEGIIAKKKNSIYEHKRSSNWLKFKCVNEQELVIGGYTDPQGSRTGFGALLVGYYKNNALHYAGKVGTGFNENTLQELAAKFKKLKTEKNPFNTNDMITKHTHWLKPQLVAQIGFTEWTRDNKLRHPRYLGLRRDKKAKDVVKE